MARCLNCGGESQMISKALETCPDCVRSDFEKVRAHLEEVHRKSREEFGLPGSPPQSLGGVGCNFCINRCEMNEGERGFCGLRSNRGGKIVGGTEEGDLGWYYDPLPTNCVADWVCPGGTGAGYPEFAYRDGPEHGYKNLAVFYQACSFNCLFCQNWHFRKPAPHRSLISPEKLAGFVDNKTSCICYFGGDPTPQLPHSLKTAELAREQRQGKIFRVCWETNGSMNSSLLRKMAEISLKSGGCIKFDLKAGSEEVNRALCGVSNQRTWENFNLLGRWIKKRPEPPLVIASTLLVPGYVDEQEVRGIASFIASVDRNIPYALLAFHPQFYMTDLPVTSRAQADACLKAAQEEGLKRVRIGNLHLLTD